MRHLCVPIFSLSVHLICHLLHIPSIIQFYFFSGNLHTLLFSRSMLCILCALCRTSCHSFFLLWGILASLYFHILCVSCGYLHMHHYSTTASASKPLNFSFLHVQLSFFQLSLRIQTFNFLLSVLVCSFSSVTSFVSNSIGIPSSLHTLYNHLLSHLILCFLHRSHSIIVHYPHSHYHFTY